MAKLRIGGGKQLPLRQMTRAFHGSLVINTRGDQMHAQAWPRPRGKKGTPAQMDARATFKNMANTVANMDDWNKLAARVLAEDTGYTWRDILSRAVVGRLIVAEGMDTMSSSIVLDDITNTPGAMLIRGPDGWIGLQPDADGKLVGMVSGEPAWIVPAPSLGALTGDVTAPAPTSPSEVTATTLAVSGVAAGSYVQANITVDAKGRLTHAVSNPSVDGITNLIGDVTAGPGSGQQTATLAASGVAAGTYTLATIIVNSKGIITGAGSGSVSPGLDQLTGDVTAGPGSGSQVATLANSGVVPGSFTTADITVDAKGRITAANSGTAVGGITTLTGDVAAGPGSGSQAAALSATGVTAGSYTLASITVDAKGRLTSAASGSVTGGITQLTGDVAAGPGSGSQASALSATGVTAGSYTLASITVDAKGRVTSASSGAASGGDYALIGTRTASGSTTLDFTGLSGRSWHLEGRLLVPSANPTNHLIRFGTGAGPTWIAAGGYQWGGFRYGITTVFNASVQNSNQNEWMIAGGTFPGGPGCSFELDIYTDNATFIGGMGHVQAKLNDGNTYQYTIGFFCALSAPVTGIRYLHNTGTIVTGQFSLYSRNT